MTIFELEVNNFNNQLNISIIFYFTFKNMRVNTKALLRGNTDLVLGDGFHPLFCN
jgi:hypothetical protein